MVKNEEANEGGKIYEVGYLLTPTLSAERLSEETAKLRDLIAREGGVFIADGEPTLRDLAYDMEKMTGHKKEIFGNAYFGWFKFELQSAALAAIKKELDTNEHVIRFLLIETVRENTLASRRAMGQNGAAPRRRDGKETMTEEEMEKTVAALVAE
ncbi:30S ribosomal protein S6 [Candidatus Parcubacteria bacterium]|nr:30S ribosomal protein S6 [Candidatus Parcubacteria bacterium]